MLKHLSINFIKFILNMNFYKNTSFFFIIYYIFYILLWKALFINISKQISKENISFVCRIKIFMKKINVNINNFIYRLFSYCCLFNLHWKWWKRMQKTCFWNEWKLNINCQITFKLSSQFFMQFLRFYEWNFLWSAIKISDCHNRKLSAKLNLKWEI